MSWYNPDWFYNYPPEIETEEEVNEQEAAAEALWEYERDKEDL
jgi:hypothetical protein